MRGRRAPILKYRKAATGIAPYCIIPYARGRIRSRTLEGVRQELLKLDGEGFKEVVLTGIHLMSYGRDLEGSVGLIDAIDQAYGLSSIRRVRAWVRSNPSFQMNSSLTPLQRGGLYADIFIYRFKAGSDTVFKAYEP